MITVILLNECNIKNIPTQQQFQQWINVTLETMSEKIPNTISEIGISIIDPETSAQLNETYRHKKGPTNVLSFPYQTTPGITLDSLGDLAICADVVENEAKNQHKNSESHWAHMTIHGTLHLLGYDHIVDADAEKMEAFEITLLKKLGYGNPYL